MLYAIQLERWRDGLPAALAGIGGEIIGNAADQAGLSVLAAIPASADADAIHAALALAGATGAPVHEVGSHAVRFTYKR
jgi:hypothetical protein